MYLNGSSLETCKLIQYKVMIQSPLNQPNHVSSNFSHFSGIQTTNYIIVGPQAYKPVLANIKTSFIKTLTH